MHSVFFRHFPEDLDSEVCELTKTTSVQESPRSERRPCSSSKNFSDATAADGGVDVAISDFGFLVGAIGISMNLGNVPASIDSSDGGLCKRGRPGRFRCVRSMAFNAAGIWLVLEDGELLCFSWLQLLCLSNAHHSVNRVPARGLLPMAHSLQDDERGLIPENGRISFLCFCPRIFSYGVTRVSHLTLYLVRIRAACLIVNLFLVLCGRRFI